MSKSVSKMSLGTVVITGPTGGLGRELALQMASRPENDRPDLLLVGRPGKNLAEITELVCKAGASAFEVLCDLSVLLFSLAPRLVFLHSNLLFKRFAPSFIIGNLS